MMINGVSFNPDPTEFNMASSTVKSNHQPLHNFPLQDLKWSMNHSNNHRFHKLPPDSDGSPLRDKKSDENSDKKSKIFIRIRTKPTKAAVDDADADADVVAVDADALDQTSLPEDAEESVPKTWNLRPRRPVAKLPNPNGIAPKIGGQDNRARTPSRPEFTCLRNLPDADKKDREKEKEKERKPRFSILLTKEQIEEDIFALTGSKPARRPKRRPKHVQKQLDSVFPGLWLASITPDSYRVPDAPSKV